MYTIEEIKEFISVLENSTLSVLDVRNGDGSSVHLERQLTAPQVINPVPVVNNSAVTAANEVASNTGDKKTTDTDVDSKTIKAPIVGVFYVAPSPNSKPYVSVGKKVSKGDTVCIIEAMKCMNEIQAEDSGEIVEVLAKDGDLVEYGQPLFRIV